LRRLPPVTLVLDMTKYVGTEKTGTNMARIRQDMYRRADACNHIGPWTAHETDAPPRGAFPTGWGDTPPL
jgi:hypothetical protein